jgi:single-stranded DNA-binding protein
LFKRSRRFHVTYGYGPVFAALANRLVKGAYVLVQGEHETRQYDKTIQVPNGNVVIEHVIKATAELKANTIKILDRAAREEDIATDEPRDDAAN